MKDYYIKNRFLGRQNNTFFQKLQRSEEFSRRLNLQRLPPAVSGQEGSVLPALGANQTAGFVEYRTLTHREKKNLKFELFT